MEKDNVSKDQFSKDEKDQFQTVNPYSGEALKTYRHMGSLEIEKAVESAYAAYQSSKSKSVATRAQELKAVAQSLRKHSPKLSELITLEMGKPINDSVSEVEKCAQACEYFSENLEKFLEAEKVSSHYPKSKIVKDSMGPILAIMPWNFPVWQAIRFAAPSIGIGNPILLKHSDQMAGTAEKMAEVFDEASKGLLYNLRIDHDQSSAVIGDKRVRGVTLTGSAKAGRDVGGTAARHLKKHVLELGGSDAYVVFADSDVKRAAEICAKGRMINNGQSCIAAKRFIVEKSAMPEFLKSFEESFRKLKRGDPMNQETQVGTLAAKKFQKQLLDQCLELEKNGAEKLMDLAKEEKFDFSGPDAFFPPRIYKVKTDLDLAFEEELFGPVPLVFEFATEKEALALANRSIYGLGGAVFTKDLEKAEKFARRLECGFVAVNDHVRSDPKLPFGGVKDSGYGRELSYYGFLEFCNIKTMVYSQEGQVSLQGPLHSAE